jgi:hypothetical protein
MADTICCGPPLGFLFYEEKQKQSCQLNPAAAIMPGTSASLPMALM